LAGVAEEGVDGLLRDKTRPSRVKPLDQAIIDKVVALTATEPPHEATHWTSPAMAKAVGISVSSVQRIWRAHGLAPHRMRHFKLSNDPDLYPSSGISSVSISIRQRTRWCSRSMSVSGR
jgi:hypothetical protein